METSQNVHRCPFAGPVCRDQMATEDRQHHSTNHLLEDVHEITRGGHSRN